MQLHLDNTSIHQTHMAEHPKEARKALQKLADQITCAICLETYSYSTYMGLHTSGILVFGK